MNIAHGFTPDAGQLDTKRDVRKLRWRRASPQAILWEPTMIDGVPVSPGTARMRRHRRRREAGQQCVTLTLHGYQVWALVACGFLNENQRHNREAVADALCGYLSEWAMPPFE